jgi:hypothetical protein
LSPQPLAVGEKRKMENWEKIWIVGMGGGFLFAAIGLYFKPDTRYVSTNTSPGSISPMGTADLKRLVETRDNPFCLCNAVSISGQGKS